MELLRKHYVCNGLSVRVSEMWLSCISQSRLEREREQVIAYRPQHKASFCFITSSQSLLATSSINRPGSLRSQSSWQFVEHQRCYLAPSILHLLQDRFLANLEIIFMLPGKKMSTPPFALLQNANTFATWLYLWRYLMITDSLWPGGFCTATLISTSWQA